MPRISSSLNIPQFVLFEPHSPYSVRGKLSTRVGEDVSEILNTHDQVYKF